MKQIHCTIGVCVYNEEQNIGSLLSSLLSQRLRTVKITEIIVVASGTTDRTVSIVKSFMKKRSRITLITERRRRGKAHAVNTVISQAKTDIVVLVGGDLIMAPDVIQRLVGAFRLEEIGMTGARPVPVPSDHTLATSAAHLLWDLHHRISLESPKMGEVVAFRKIFKRIPSLSSVDEANIEPLIRGQGYKIVYIPRAVVYNKAPSTVSDFIRQRRRIYNGHMTVKYEQSYVVSTYKLRSIVTALVSYVRENPHVYTLGIICFTVLLEAVSRFLGWWDYRIAKKRHTIWEVVTTTKNPHATQHLTSERAHTRPGRLPVLQNR